VLSIAEVVEHPQFVVRQRFVEAEHPVHGRFRQTGAVLAGQSQHIGPYELREHGTTDTHLLRDVGYTDDEIASLKEASVIA
jgi:crotonobetainyl-CoA:carnitine CoA-transferase CaiB-like acyl-CoA transferase